MSKTERIVAETVRRWRENLSSLDWYLRLEGDIRHYFFRSPQSDLEMQIRWALYDLVAEALEKGRVGLGEEGINWDTERKPVQFAVIHHSGTDPNVSTSRLSAMGLLRLYAFVYLNQKEYPEAYGRPIHSHHWKGDSQVFYAYHWSIRPDGVRERLLEDHHIGWHCGDWAMNCASIGICLAGNYSSKRPTSSTLETLKNLLKTYRAVKVIPHCAINPRSKCPGSWSTTENWSFAA